MATTSTLVNKIKEYIKRDQQPPADLVAKLHEHGVSLRDIEVAYESRQVHGRKMKVS